MFENEACILEWPPGESHRIALLLQEYGHAREWTEPESFTGLQQDAHRAGSIGFSARLLDVNRKTEGEDHEACG